MKQFISKYGMFITAVLSFFNCIGSLFLYFKHLNYHILEGFGVLQLFLFISFLYCVKLYNDAFNEYLNKTFGERI